MLRALCSQAHRARRARALCQSASPPQPQPPRSFEHLQTSVDERIATIHIHRPRHMNALNDQTIDELIRATRAFDRDPTVSVIILTGSSRVFAAGNDIAQLAAHSFHAARFRRDLGSWTDAIAATSKPLVAAVSGFALGGGCELAMAADIVIASEDAQFGQPEVQLGTVPSAGGTQRLVRAVGKAKAMELVLTGRKMDASEAESVGLVSRVARNGEALKEARDVAAVIARYSLPVVAAAKECVNVAFETSLSQGLLFEKRAFQSTFGLDDQSEGMKAFIDQRKPEFKNR
eukprot:TRINITY_DN415_c0_g1_i1.p1 TRINITY_DN415_c0_g1~~TRINITY_DN415_c0_g1_i1.p1  ORF type:complete len:289 (-),score=73.21 TRINITY_DN415_c0_g1_i1:111-977(-)